MAPGISLDDHSAWDDSALINSWDDAVAEYQKYHSISKSGKRLEDVLTEEELERLRGDHGDLLDEEMCDGSDQRTNADATGSALPKVQANGVGQGGADAAHVQDRATPVVQGSAEASGTEVPHDGPFSASMPQALLASVQDENMKNLMMSWYYAGYYTGLVAGQQGPPDDASQQKQK
ncbi:hypothetical protein P171DRAFT_72670 [Karstenula rhodostoma CBS 690.94]|uniref:Survival Motor Neuron Gemin2-binding domain-containing protein n=1 Tax=Karstenula rhodostoma CBS 690.94 TaxID=1392251 RepID=A0A9P4PAK5_9PLEO|nr:hypothetical protein P171DRAFT_72670 [Karstenula rhodostoma CBS 690.94]